MPLDLRHVLSGECSEGVTAEEQARAVALLGGLGAALPLRADEGKDAGEHDAAMRRESQLAAGVFGSARVAGLRDAASWRAGAEPLGRVRLLVQLARLVLSSWPGGFGRSARAHLHRWSGDLVVFRYYVVSSQNMCVVFPARH